MLSFRAGRRRGWGGSRLVGEEKSRGQRTKGGHPLRQEAWQRRKYALVAVAVFGGLDPAWAGGAASNSKAIGFAWGVGGAPAVVAFSADGRDIVSAHDSSLRYVRVHRWNRASGRRVDITMTNPEPFQAQSGSDEGYGPMMDLSRDGKVLAFRGSRETIFIWDLISNKLSHRYPTTRAEFALSPDGTLIAYPAPGHEEDDVLVVQISTGKILGKIPTRNTGWKVFSGDSRVLAVLRNDRRALLVWDVTSMRKRLEIMTPAGFAVMGSFAVSRNGDALAAKCDGKGKSWVFCWDAQSGRERFRKEFDQRIYAEEIQFSPDGRSLAAGMKSRLYVWKADTGAKVMESGRSYEWAFHGPMAFAPDSETLVTSSSEGVLRLWNVDKGTQVSGP